MINYRNITDRRDASLTAYFKEVSRLPLISPEEEKKLARKIQKGDKRAEEKLVKANLRFVITIAKQYQHKGLPLVDLIQEGNIGIIKAAQKWNPNKGIKFIYYAVWWIRQAIIKAIADQCRMIRMPASQVIKLTSINKASQKIEQTEDRIPTAYEIADDIIMNPVKVRQSIEANVRPISLESPLQQDDDIGCFGDLLTSDTQNPDQVLDAEDLGTQLEIVLEKLPTRSSDAIRMYYGIGMPAMSYAKISRKLGISNERIRQLVQEGLKRIRVNYSDKLSKLL